MYRNIQNIKDVFGFSVTNGSVACCLKSGKVFVYDSSSLAEVWSRDVQNPSEVIWYDDILYVRDSGGQGKNLFFRSNGDLIKSTVQKGIDYSVDQFSNMVRNRVVCFIENDSNQKMGLLSIKSLEFLWINDVDFFNSLQTPDFVFTGLISKKDAVVCLSALNGRLLWQLNLDNLLSRPDSIYADEDRYTFKVVKFIGVHTNKLVVSVTWDPATNRLLTINCDTGLVDKYWSELDLKTPNHLQRLPSGPNILFLHGYNKIERETQFAEINIESGKVERKGIVASLLREGLVLKDWTCKNDKIYFTAIKEGRFATHIGILSYINFDLLWWQRIEMRENAFLVQGKGPEVDGDHIYVLDTEGGLHFFKETHQV